MSKLCISLPPFAPDYSGAASALFDMGGMIVIHDASGCTGNYTGYDEPRWLGSETAVYCSALRHMDAVLGNDEKVIGKIVKAAEELKPKFIAILGSPVPMVIGTDFAGIANEIECITGIPAIGLSTRGLAYYGKGIADATIALMKKFVKGKKDVLSGAINLLGITPLDFHINGNNEDFRRLFEENGIKVLASYSMGMKLEEMQDSIGAQLNVVVSQAGIAVAKYMKQKYKIPYVTVTPMGDGIVALEKVKATLADCEKSGAFVNVPESGKVNETPEICSNNTVGDKYCNPSSILIAGEQVICNSMREYLQKKYNVGAITVAGLFDMSQEHMQPGDIDVKNEKHLREVLNSGQYQVIVGDPMIWELIREEQAEHIKFYEWPHVALSSKVHWNDYKRFLSEETELFLKNVAE